MKQRIRISSDDPCYETCEMTLVAGGFDGIAEQVRGLEDYLGEMEKPYGVRIELVD